MSARPLYRWKSFWFGVLVLASIGWGWKSSTQRYFCMHWGSPAGRWIARLENQSGYIRIQAGLMPTGAKAISGVEIHNWSLPRSERSWRSKDGPVRWLRPLGVHMIHVDYWLVMVTAFAGWGCLLVWKVTAGRGRRAARKLEPVSVS